MSIPQNDKRRCYNCKFYYRQDEGYSNYTVELTQVHCLRGKNPKVDGESEGYDWETEDHEFMKVAETCDSFARGEPLFMDCDHEAVPFDVYAERSDYAKYYTDDAEVIAAYREFMARP